MAIALGGNSINKAYLGTTEIQKMYLGGDLVFDNTVVPSNLTPILTNFRVEDATPTQVHFDTPLGPVTGMTTLGFEITGNTILAVDTVNNYFTVQDAFDSWDNTTIRLGENSDTSDRQTVLHNFTLSNNKNNITEPTATTNRYVAVGGSGNGTSEGAAASLTYMASNAAAGQTWWIKAGDYGDTRITLGNSGTVDNPIKYIGYKTTIGDITTNYFDYGVTMSSSEMPTLTGPGPASLDYNDIAISITGNYFILRNIQTYGYGRSIYAGAGYSNHFIIDRFNIEDNYSPTDSNATGIHLSLGGAAGHNHFRILDCTIINCTQAAISVTGQEARYNLIQGIKTYNDQTGTIERQDYHIAVKGDFNIIRDCYAENFNNTTTSGSTHGIGILAGYTGRAEYNLIEDSTAINFNETFYVRNSYVEYNVIKNCYSGNNGNTDPGSPLGLYIYGEANYNTFENCLTEDVETGIFTIDKQYGAEDNIVSDRIGTGNKFINCIFNNLSVGCISLNGTSGEPGYTSDMTDTKLINCTWNNCDNWLYNNTSTTVDVQNFQVIGNILNNVTDATAGVNSLDRLTFTDCTFFGSDAYFTSLVGSNGNIDVDPNLDANFVPQGAIITASTAFGAEYDYSGTTRNKTTTTIGSKMSASEDNGGTTPPVTDADYYVANDGLDTNPGTEAQPWQTLSKVETEITSADAGKVIAFKKGDEWNELLDLTDVKGTLGNEITFTSYGSGAKPIINNRTVSTFSWALVSGSIWKTTLTDAPQRLIVDGTERLGGANIEYAQLGDLVPDRVEWWHGSGELYFWSATTPNALEFEYSTAAQGQSLYLLGSDYLVFDGIDLRGGDVTSVTIYGCENLEFKNNEIGIMSNSGIRALYSPSLTRHCSSISIHDNNFDTKFDFDYSNIGDYPTAENTGADDGVYIRSLKVGSVYNNTFRNWGHAEISISPQGTEVGGYVAHDINVYGNTFTMTIAYGRGFGMSGNAYNVDVYNNQFITCPTPIQFNGYNNNFYGNTITASYQTPLKAWRQPAMNLQGYGINSHTNIIEDNDFIDCTQPAFGIDGNNYSCNVEDNIFRNNNISNCGGANSGLSIDLLPTESAGFEAINNTFTGNNIYSPLSSITINDNGTMRTVATWNGTTTVGNTVSGNTANQEAQNIVTEPFDLTSAAWDKINGSITGTTESTPSGSDDGCIFTSTGSGTCRYTTVELESTTQYSLKYFYKNIDSAQHRVFVYDVTNGVHLVEEVISGITTEYQELEYLFTTTTATTVYLDVIRTVTASVSAWNVRLTKV